MKVSVIRSILEDESNKSGIGYYADFLEEQLTRMGHEIKVVDFELDLRRGFKNLLFDNIILSIINIFMHQKNNDVTHFTAEHCALFMPLTRGKRIVTFHHVVKDNEIESRSWKTIWSLSALFSKIFADRFIAISPQTKEDMVNLLGIREDTITVIMHPPNSKMYRTGAKKDDIFLFIGTLSGRKNPQAAVSVFEKIVKTPKYNDFKLVICGGGPIRNELISRIEERGLTDYILMTDNLSVDELRDLYNRSRAVLNTSNFEGMGITTLEAQLCGTPVLYFKDAHIPPETTVAAISCVDEEDMAEKAIELLENDEMATSISEEGILFAKGFGKNYIEKLKEIYYD